MLRYLLYVLIGTVLALLLGWMFGTGLGLGVNLAHARDYGQWDSVDPTIRHWYQSLMRPDYPTSPCCGEADAYWADSYEVKGDHYVAIITDDRDDAPLRRPHLPVGTRIEVPNNKLKFDAGNPTGHGVIFFGVDSQTVFCFVVPGGV